MTELHSRQELEELIQSLLRSCEAPFFRFTEQERRILQLWDQEQELLLELRVSEAQAGGQEKSMESRLSEADLHAQISQAEKTLLATRSKHSIRTAIIEQVVMMDPILKALHTGADVTELETRLVPLIRQRDTAAMIHTILASQLQVANQTLASLEQKVAELNHTNHQTTQKMLELVRDAKLERIEEIQEPRLRAQVQKQDEELDVARREWRVLKSVTGSIIAGSGVDWAADPRLLEAVIDEEDELG